jgi:hypothetical protein
VEIASYILYLVKLTCFYYGEQHAPLRCLRSG